MDRVNAPMRKTFDFSLDAGAFRERLWKVLEESRAESGVQMLEDDDLEWVNAAGVVHPGKEKDSLK